MSGSFCGQCCNETHERYDYYKLGYKKVWTYTHKFNESIVHTD